MWPHTTYLLHQALLGSRYCVVFLSTKAVFSTSLQNNVKCLAQTHPHRLPVLTVSLSKTTFYTCTQIFLSLSPVFKTISSPEDL